jgi:RNA binding exosome subunit
MPPLSVEAITISAIIHHTEPKTAVDFSALGLHITEHDAPGIVIFI